MGWKKCGINALASIARLQGTLACTGYYSDLASIARLKGTLACTGYYSVVPYYINFPSQNYPGKL